MPKGQIRVKMIPNKRLKEFMKALDPDTANSVARKALTDMVQAASANAAAKQIDRGRGRHAPVMARKLTYRSGGLAGSIGHSLTRLPRSAEFGSTMIYAPIHERGLTVRRPVGPSKSNKETGRLKGSAVYPKRPFLAPAARYVKKHLAANIWNRRLLEARR